MPTAILTQSRVISALMVSKTILWQCSKAILQRTGRKNSCLSSLSTSKSGTTLSITSPTAQNNRSGAAMVLQLRNSTSRVTTIPTTPTLRLIKATTAHGRLRIHSHTTRPSALTHSTCCSVNRLLNSKATNSAADAGTSLILRNLLSTTAPATSFIQKMPAATSPAHRHTSTCMAVLTPSTVYLQCLPV